MKNTKKQLLAKYLLAASILVSGASESFAGALSQDVLNLSRQYTDDQLYNAVQAGLTQIVHDRATRLNNTITTSPGGGVSYEVVAEAAFNNVDSVSRMGLIPINQSGVHWTAMALRRNLDMELVVIYNDSVGAALNSNADAVGVLNEITRLNGDVLPIIIDARVRNQTGGVACGAHAAESLIEFAQIPEANLNEAEVQKLLNQTIFKDERALRALQYLNSQDPAQDRGALTNNVINAVDAGDRSLQVSSIVTNNLDHVTNDLNRRMHDLVVSSGDESKANYGVWVGGSIGRGVYKNKKSSLSSAKEKSNMITFGSDIKINDQYMIGAFVSIVKNQLDSTINGNLNSKSKTNVNSTIFGLYGNVMVTEDVMISSSIYGGKMRAKNKDAAQIGSNRKGSLMGANLAATYYYKFENNLTLAPTIGVNANQVKLGKDSSSVLSINGLTGKKVSLYAGVALSKSFDVAGFTISPELSGKFTYSPVVKNSKTKVNFLSSGIVIPMPASSSADKTMVSLGASVNIVKNNTVEVSVGYQKDLQSQYKGDTGFAKLRINF